MGLITVNGSLELGVVAKLASFNKKNHGSQAVKINWL